MLKLTCSVALLSITTLFASLPAHALDSAELAAGIADCQQSLTDSLSRQARNLPVEMYQDWLTEGQRPIANSIIGNQNAMIGCDSLDFYISYRTLWAEGPTADPRARRANANTYTEIPLAPFLPIPLPKIQYDLGEATAVRVDSVDGLGNPKHVSGGANAVLNPILLCQLPKALADQHPLNALTSQPASEITVPVYRYQKCLAKIIR